MDFKGLAWHHVAWPITLFSPEAMPFTSPSGKPWIPYQERKGVLGQLAALRSLHDLARGTYSLGYPLFAGGCLCLHFLMTVRQPGLFQLQ